MESFIRRLIEYFQWRIPLYIHTLTIWDPQPDWKEEVLPDYNAGDLLKLREVLK